MLNNVVAIRYGDPPSFIDVSSIISSYALTTDVGATVLDNNIPQRSNQIYGQVAVRAGVSYADRPTITYAPLSGEKLTKRLIRPIPPVGIFELIQAGQPADLVLQVAVRAINGIKNQGISGGVLEPADPQFYPLIDAFRRLQIDGHLSVRTEKRGGQEGGEFGVFVITEGRSPQSIKDVAFISETLKLRPDKQGEFVIVFGAIPRTGKELAVLSRSMGNILVDLAMGIDVPEAHVASGETIPTVRISSADNMRERPLVKIRSGPNAPTDAYAATSYGNMAYWIDKNDFDSKRTFALLMVFTSLAETGTAAQIPILTVPVH
jgi:hypothetical protein